MKDNLFRGYVPTKNKKCLVKFKDKELSTFEQVKDLDEYAGIIAKDIVLIDIDDQDQAEIMMNIVEDMQLDCRVYQTTRGKHFFFKNSGIDKCATKVKLACGLTADIKAGCHNSYSVLKFNGNERFIEWDVENGKEYQKLPKWLLPISSNIDFLNLEEGDGRNTSLFTYILTLTNYGFSKEESKECLRIINKYLLKESLSEEEIETITRDEAFPKDTFYDGTKFLHNNFALFMKNNDHIRRINGQLHIYKDGIYVYGVKELESKMIRYIPTMKANQRVEVLKYLEIICEDAISTNANLIAFNNGIYDITTDELKEFSPDYVITNKIPWNYDPTTYSELGDITLNKLACQDESIRMLLEECIGYTFYRRNELSKAFVLTGDKSNGKSTFLDMIKNLLGKDNYSALDLSELDERFSVASMAGKLANIGDDISDEFLQGRSIATFKKIVSGNQIKAEYKGQDAFFFDPYVKLLFSANEIPRMKDKTGAVLRRLVIIPFNARFSKDDPDYDPYITWKLKDEQVMKYLVVLGIEGLKRVIENKAFSESEKVTKELRDYEIQNNPIMLFLQERDINEIENQSTQDVHKAYRVFCVENGYTEMTLSNFSKEINRRLGLVVKRIRIEGKRIGIYVKG